MTWIVGPLLAMFTATSSENIADMTISSLLRIANEIQGDPYNRGQSLLQKGASLRTQFKDTMREISDDAVKNLTGRIYVSFSGLEEVKIK